MYWGGEEGRGSEVGENQEVPDFQETEVIDVSAGSRHSFIINENGKASASGFIESFYGYKGHLGLDRSMLSEGPNDFMTINHQNFAFSFPISLLGGRNLVIENQNICITLLKDLEHFLDLTLTKNETG